MKKQDFYQSLMLQQIILILITKIYRDGYGIFASNGILFNHESPEEVKHLLQKDNNGYFKYYK